MTGGLAKAGWAPEAVEKFVRAIATAAGDEEVEMRCKVADRSAAKIAAGKRAWGWPKLADFLREQGRAVVGRVREWLGLLDAQSAGAATQKTPVRPPDPFQPFPVEALPEPVRSFVAQGTVAIGCDPSFLALPALSVVASLIGTARSVRLKRDWYEPSVIWSGVVGDSGTLKSPAVGAVVGPLYRLQRDLIKQFKVDVEQYQQAKEAWDERKRQAKREEKAFDEEEPEQPTLNRVVTGDVTIEKLAELLEDNPKGLLTCRDELGGWLASSQRYKGKGGGSDLPNWLELSRAGTIQVDRKTGNRPTLFIQHAAVSITGGIQPGPLAHALTAEHMEAGLAARILMAMPPRRRKEWTEAEIAPEVREAYEKLLRQLRDLQLDKGRDGEKEPFAVRLTPEAKEVWVRFYQEWAAAQASVEGDLAAAYSKLEGYAARLALLHHVVGRVGDMEDCQPIEAASMEAGIVLARWFAYEARRIYVTLAETENQKNVRRLIEFIRSHGGRTTARRLHLSNKSRYPDAAVAQAALDELVAAGVADWVAASLGRRGGRPSRTAVLKPDTTCFKSYETDEDDDEDGGPNEGGGTSEPTTKPPPAGGNPVKNGGFVGFEACSTKTTTSADAETRASTGGQEVGAREGVSEYERGRGITAHEPTADRNATTDTTCANTDTTFPAADRYLLVADAPGLEMVRRALEETALVGLDCETTGLNPRTDKLWLLCLNCDTTDGGRFTYVIDCFRVEPRPLWVVLAERPIVAHNALFDLQFLAAVGFTPGTVHCTMTLSQLLHGSRKGKGFHTLAQVAERELGRPVDKTEQRSDWSGELTREQLDYAANDAGVLAPLYAALSAKVQAAGMAAVAEIERRCLPALAWLAGRGMPFDLASWEALAREAAREAKALERRLDEAAPPRKDRLLAAGAWQWSSPKQVKEAFAALGFPLDGTDDDALAEIDHPLAALLRDYRSAAKRASTYGAAWPKGCREGRIFAQWRQIGCVTGRMACASPNLQNLPADVRYRRCFAAPPGRVLIKADYSQIELRIAARISGDEAMLRAYAEGLDLHTLTAQRMLGKGDVTPLERKLAKPVNFGLIYGLGVTSLRKKAKADYGLDLSPEDAARYRDAFFAAYPGVARWHGRIRVQRAPETRTLARRRCLVEPEGFYGGKANYAVQGTGGDGFKAALGLLWESRADIPDALPVAVVHDEILVEASAEGAEAAKEWLTRAMIDGMAPLIAPVPVEVEAQAARTWGGE